MSDSPIPVDDHGQPVFRFCHSRNKERALNGLIGICFGITADRRLVDREIAYLSAWLSTYTELLAEDGDAVDLVHAIRRALADGVLTHEEREDIQDLILTVTEYRGMEAISAPDVAMQQLTGVIHGVLADGELRDQEVAALAKWICLCRGLKNNWPASVILQRIADILADGVIDADERQDLVELLERFVGGSMENTGTVGGMATRAFTGCPVPDEIEFGGKTFVLTGRFARGTRSHCEQLVKERGGQVAGNVTRATDYLIVGLVASRDWKNESFGRKIEQAMNMRAQGHGILVLEEELWVQHL